MTLLIISLIYLNISFLGLAMIAADNREINKLEFIVFFGAVVLLLIGVSIRELFNEIKSR